MNSLSYLQLVTLHESLLFAITRNSGIGFPNRDQGHPFVSSPAESGKAYPNTSHSPDRCEMFYLLNEVIAAINAASNSEPMPLMGWQDFNAMALKASNEHRRF